MLGENIFKEPVKKYIPVYVLERFAIIPGRWANKPVICPFIPPIEEVAPESILQIAEGLHTLHDIRNGDPFAEILKQPVTE